MKFTPKYAASKIELTPEEYEAILRGEVYTGPAASARRKHEKALCANPAGGTLELNQHELELLIAILENDSSSVAGNFVNAIK